MEERFRVGLGKFKKLITVTHGITTLEDLRNDINNAFAKCPIYKNEEFVVQYFNEQFREFIDLDDITELTLLIDKTLQIMYIDEMCEFKDDIDRKAPINSSSITEESQNETISESQSGSEVLEQSTEIIEHTKDVVTWSYPFVVKDRMLHSFVLRKLETCEPLGSKERVKLLDGFYDECSKYTLYPSSQQYTDMVTALLHRWPHLCEGLSLVDAIHLWKYRMRCSFKNLRRRTSLKDDKRVKEMKLKFGKRKIDQCEAPSPEHQKDIWGMVNFLPSREIGEDDETINDYIKKLKQQNNLNFGRRNVALVDLAMDKTFPERRDMLIVKLARISEILDIYPMLTEGEQILCEFKKVAGWDLKENFYSGIKKHSSEVLGLQSKVILEKTRGLMMKIAEPQPDSQKEYISVCTSLVAISCLLKEDLMSVFNENNATPVIITSKPLTYIDIIDTTRNFNVVVEGREVCKSNDFIYSFMVMFACYYTFNLSYDSKLDGSLTFLQKYLLNIGDSVRPKPKVLALIGKLKNCS